MNFFNESLEILLYKRNLLIQVLTDYEFSENSILNFLEAFDYFIVFPGKFDGATIVRDSYLIKELDLCAMVHDYMYVKYNLPVNFKHKIKADIFYCKLLRKFNISWWSVWVVRFLGLLISTPFYGLYKKVKYNQTHSLQNSLEFNIYINKFS